VNWSLRPPSLYSQRAICSFTFYLGWPFAHRDGFIYLLLRLPLGLHSLSFSHILSSLSNNRGVDSHLKTPSHLSFIPVTGNHVPTLNVLVKALVLNFPASFIWFLHFQVLVHFLLALSEHKKQISRSWATVQHKVLTFSEIDGKTWCALGDFDNFPSSHFFCLADISRRSNWEPTPVLWDADKPWLPWSINEAPYQTQPDCRWSTPFDIHLFCQGMWVSFHVQ
jgi:hypothetical protein